MTEESNVGQPPRCTRRKPPSTMIDPSKHPQPPASHRYRWLLFDADGTLFNYERAESSALQNTFAETGLAFLPEYLPMYGEINQRCWTEFEQGRISSQTLRVRRFELLFETAGIQADAAAFNPIYLRHLANSSQLMEGAEETIQALSEHYRLAIITNGIKEVQRSRLEKSTIGQYFSLLVISEEAGAAKPDPQFFDVAFEQMARQDDDATDQRDAADQRGAREAALVIGDSLSSDIRGANNYGLDVCWFNPGGLARPDNSASGPVSINYEIHHLRELLPLLNGKTTSRGDEK